MAARGQTQELELDASASEEEPALEGYETPDDFEVFEDDYEEENDRPVGRERAGIYLTALVALAVPSIIVLAFFLPAADNQSAEAPATSNESSVGLDETVVTEEEVTLVVAEDESAPALAVEEADEPELAIEAEVESAVIEADIAPEPEVAPEPEAASTSPVPVVDIDPEAIEVTVYNQDPPDNGRVQFALRLNGIATTSEIDTSLFTVEVHDSRDAGVTTSYEFLHETLPVDSSALATVSATGLDSGAHFVVISIGDVEIAKLLLDMGAFS